MPRHWQVLLMAALGIGATVVAVPRALSGIVDVPHIAEAGISRTAASVPSTKPSTAKVPVWSAPATKAKATAASATTVPADTRPPSGVTGLRLLANNETTISLTWDVGQDNVAVKLYVIKGDGFSTMKTSDTKATVSWPGRKTSVSVQVAAVDTSGNQGEWRSIVVSPPTSNAPASATTSATSSAPSTPPATTTTPAVTTSAPSQPPASTSASTSVSTAASTVASTAAASTIQSAGGPGPSTAAASADPSSAQSI